MNWGIYEELNADKLKLLPLAICGRDEWMSGILCPMKRTTASCIIISGGYREDYGGYEHETPGY
jgi:hypothetical protein